jgi:alkanesulfonate monooxygenase SsuD/methylene tetrahydromethanopterin reductase-like flavin-dependent oxidoreductase (luciferase family)
VKLAVIFSPAAGHTYIELRDFAREAERVGIESFWVSDHFFGGPVGVPDQDCLEAFTLLAALARDTTRIRLGVLVAAAQYRNPALLAKIVAGVDQMSDGVSSSVSAPDGRPRSTARTDTSSRQRALASSS